MRSRVSDWRLSLSGFNPSYGKLVCLATLMSSDRTKQICLWMNIYIYIYISTQLGLNEEECSWLRLGNPRSVMVNSLYSRILLNSGRAIRLILRQIPWKPTKVDTPLNKETSCLRYIEIFSFFFFNKLYPKGYFVVSLERGGKRTGLWHRNKQVRTPVIELRLLTGPYCCKRHEIPHRSNYTLNSTTTDFQQLWSYSSIK